VRHEYRRGGGNPARSGRRPWRWGRLRIPGFWITPDKQSVIQAATRYLYKVWCYLS